MRPTTRKSDRIAKKPRVYYGTTTTRAKGRSVLAKRDALKTILEEEERDRHVVTPPTHTADVNVGTSTHVAEVDVERDTFQNHDGWTIFDKWEKEEEEYLRKRGPVIPPPPGRIPIPRNRLGRPERDPNIRGTGKLAKVYKDFLPHQKNSRPTSEGPYAPQEEVEFSSQGKTFSQRLESILRPMLNRFKNQKSK